MEGQMQTADEIKRRKAQSSYFGTRGKDLNDESKYTAIFLHAMFPQPGSVCCLKILRPSAFLREHVYTCTYNLVPLQILEFAISSPFTRSRASHIFNLVLYFLRSPLGFITFVYYVVALLFLLGCRCFISANCRPWWVRLELAAYFMLSLGFYRFHLFGSFFFIGLCLPSVLQSLL
jgi:hypothetical protein